VQNSREYVKGTKRRILLKRSWQERLHSALRFGQLYSFPQSITLLRIGMFIFVDEQFLYQLCTARTRLNSGENVLPARENSSPKITSAPLAANAWTAAKEPIPFTNLRGLPTKAAMRISPYGNLLIKKTDIHLSG